MNYSYLDSVGSWLCVVDQSEMIWAWVAWVFCDVRGSWVSDWITLSWCSFDAIVDRVRRIFSIAFGFWCYSCWYYTWPILCCRGAILDCNRCICPELPQESRMCLYDVSYFHTRPWYCQCKSSWLYMPWTRNMLSFPMWYNGWCPSVIYSPFGAISISIDRFCCLLVLLIMQYLFISGCPRHGTEQRRRGLLGTFNFPTVGNGSI